MPMPPEISELTERQQNRRFNLGIALIAFGMFGSFFCFAGAVIYGNARRLGPETMTYLTLTPIVLGLATILIGIYFFLRGWDKTKYSARRALTAVVASMVILIIILTAILKSPTIS